MSTGRRRRVIAALGIAQILAWGASYYLPAILARPIEAEMGWPLAWVVGGLSVGLLVAGLVAVRVGHAIERHGGRPVLATSVVLLALGLAILAATNGLVVFFLAWVVLGIGMAAGLYDAAFSCLGRIFGSEARPAITALTLWGGFASTVCWPISAFLAETFGWRGACLVYAAVFLIVVLPLLLVILPREERRESGMKHAAAPESGETPPGRRRLAFAILSLMMTAGGAIMAVWSVHAITILQAGGLTLAGAVALGALVGPAQVGGRVIEMLTGGRCHAMWTLAASVILVALGMTLLWMGFPIPALSLVLYGAGNGIWSIARGTVPLALFGPHGYAVLIGKLAVPSLLAQAAAPPIGALLLDSVGADGTLAVLAAIALGSLAGFLLLATTSIPRR
ncbi:MAG: MFS transporter [Alphaproteobacteria bacterium]|nr:MFS transporter [Alphaproteobacteria bacterium]